MPLGQENRFIRFVGDSSTSLILLGLRGKERFSSPYEYQIQFCTTQATDNVERYLGKELSCEIGQDKNQRFVSGVLTHIEEANSVEGLNTFIGLLEPRISLLHLGKNLAVFQNITVPDLVCKLLRQHSISSVDLRLRGSYEPREYCIQYRESDFDFISRLLEQEGIYYFFQHESGQHTLVLADHPSSHQTTKPAQLPFMPVAGTGDGVGVLSWSSHSSLSASSVQLKGFNMLQAASVMGESKTADPQHSIDGIAYVDIHGYDKRDQLQSEARLKMEQLEAENRQFDADISVYWLNCGETFTLSDHPSSNGNYRIKALELAASSNIDGNAADFTCKVSVLEDNLTWRPAALTPVPDIGGVLTATVVGPKSEEVHTDEYGRIKIQFPWDNENHFDDGSSCWVRVSQPWAGGRFGAIFLPRVGSEVIISFVQGHPDYPLVTGTVFNGLNKPPLSLPGEKNHTGFVSRSSLNGSVEEGHELRFDDKKGEERLVMTSQRDLLLTVKNDVISKIAKKVTETIGEDRVTEITKGKDSLTLKSGDYSLDIQGNLQQSLKGGDHHLKISGGGSSVKADKACVIESTQSIELKVGSSKISISPTGITISGTTIKIEGTGTAELKGAMVTVQGSGMTQIKGGVTMIG